MDTRRRIPQHDSLFVYQNKVLFLHICRAVPLFHGARLIHITAVTPSASLIHITAVTPSPSTTKIWGDLNRGRSDTGTDFSPSTSSFPLLVSSHQCCIRVHASQITRDLSNGQGRLIKCHFTCTDVEHHRITIDCCKRSFFVLRISALQSIRVKYVSQNTPN
jgi:hypothetical protein